MSRLICEKCEKELDPKTIVANNVYSCQKCGLVEAIQSKNNSINEVNKEDLSKYYLNEEQTVFLSLSEETATIEGNGKINNELWNNLKKELNLKEYSIEIKEGIQLPDNCFEMFDGFKKELSIHPNIDTSNVESMDYMFCNTKLANPDVSNWDTSKVKSMYGMFERAASANPDTSNWDVSNVKNMSCMFRDAPRANPNTTNWNTSKVKNMSDMFVYAASANPNTSNWDVSNVKNMTRMFFGATSANPDTSNWFKIDTTLMFDGSAYTGKLRF